MAMDFWQEQAQASRKTKRLVAVFFGLLVLVVAGTEAIFWESGNHFVGVLMVGIILLTAWWNLHQVSSLGGAYVAESVGAERVDPDTATGQARQLVNIIDEMAIASSVPRPAIYIIPAACINAFAAGPDPSKAAIAVTQGCLDKLTRDELQGVVAHEFGHIHNHDMKLSMQLSAMLMGFYVLLFIGWRIFYYASFLKGGDKKENAKMAVMGLGLLFLIAGFVLWIGGLFLRAAVSRQREYLADACGAQFTRHPDGLASALRKIQADSVSDMPKEGGAYAHMYLNFDGSFLATHPPIEKRIAALEGRKI